MESNQFIVEDPRHRELLLLAGITSGLLGRAENIWRKKGPDAAREWMEREARRADVSTQVLVRHMLPGRDLSAMEGFSVSIDDMAKENGDWPVDAPQPTVTVTLHPRGELPDDDDGPF